MSRNPKPGRCAVPCRSCPWRVDRGASTIPNYDHVKAVGLLNTVGDGDGMRPIMACHNSSDEKMIACKGYLAREGFNNINVRLLLIRGEIDNPDDVARTCKTLGIELEPDYPSVLSKLSGR